MHLPQLTGNRHHRLLLGCVNGNPIYELHIATDKLSLNVLLGIPGTTSSTLTLPADSGWRFIPSNLWISLCSPTEWLNRNCRCMQRERYCSQSTNNNIYDPEKCTGGDKPAGIVILFHFFSRAAIHFTTHITYGGVFLPRSLARPPVD